ncbi:unnamed protein product [marine sediment metagenome]|uniref:Uncharacterized protein n=1 Tax=marine sediment metagenome TaxID=412755 RepID=X1KLT2_9ZZZZ
MPKKSRRAKAKHRARLAQETQRKYSQPLKPVTAQVQLAGKAANISNRVKSYFAASGNLSSKTQQLVLQLYFHNKFIVTGSLDVDKNCPSYAKIIFNEGRY